jgi:hypothetical protein
MRTTRRNLGNLTCYLITAGFILMAMLSVLHGKEKREISPVQYGAHGRLQLPASFREWIFLGAVVTPDELNQGRAAFPGIHHIYMDPAGFEYYRRTGKFRDGTMLAKELATIEAKQAPSGTGYFPGRLQGLNISLKSSSRHPDSPGNWGFYYFGPKPPYEASTGLQAEEACMECHRAGDEELVFSRFYPVLRALKPEK